MREESGMLVSSSNYNMLADPRGYARKKMLKEIISLEQPGQRLRN